MRLFWMSVLLLLRETASANVQKSKDVKSGWILEMGSRDPNKPSVILIGNDEGGDIFDVFEAAEKRKPSLAIASSKRSKRIRRQTDDRPAHDLLVSELLGTTDDTDPAEEDPVEADVVLRGVAKHSSPTVLGNILARDASLPMSIRRQLALTVSRARATANKLQAFEEGQQLIDDDNNVGMPRDDHVERQLTDDDVVLSPRVDHVEERVRPEARYEQEEPSVVVQQQPEQKY